VNGRRAMPMEESVKLEGYLKSSPHYLLSRCQNMRVKDESRLASLNTRYRRRGRGSRLRLLLAPLLLNAWYFPLTNSFGGLLSQKSIFAIVLKDKKAEDKKFPLLAGDFNSKRRLGAAQLVVPRGASYLRLKPEAAPDPDKDGNSSSSTTNAGSTTNLGVRAALSVEQDRAADETEDLNLSTNNDSPDNETQTFEFLLPFGIEASIDTDTDELPLIVFNGDELQLQPMLDNTTASVKEVQEQLQDALNTTETAIRASIDTFQEGIDTIREFGNKTMGEPSAIPELLCRVVADGDRRLPDRDSASFPRALAKSSLLYYLDAIFHAVSHEESAHLRNYDKMPALAKNGGWKINATKARMSGYYNEMELISVLKDSLDDAGFVVLSQRDIDLCEALNAGYLLRLSIVPDVREFESNLGVDFFPNETMVSTEALIRSVGSGDKDSIDSLSESTISSVLPYDGRVLVFRRGYSSEITEGRLIVPKLDYLQASLVQRSASGVVEKFSKFERRISFSISQTGISINRSCRAVAVKFLASCPPRSIPRKLNRRWKKEQAESSKANKLSKSQQNKRQRLVKLSRYGGSKLGFVDSVSSSPGASLDPFLARPVRDKEDGTSSIACEYDLARDVNNDPSAQLLERVSISDLIDFFSRGGRRRLLRTFLSKSQLVEPTYEEVSFSQFCFVLRVFVYAFFTHAFLFFNYIQVVVIWRPQTTQKKKTKKRLQLPKVVYDVAEIFAVEDQLPKKAEPEPSPELMPLEISVFKNVQLSNLPAVFPKTRLVFRPADAFLFDAISVFTLLAVLASQRFDNPQFDLIAIVSVVLWLLRTFIRYSNKLARYDLLVKKFLTSKLAQRGSGALKYITTEAGYQRASRAALLFQWISDNNITSKEAVLRDGAEGTCKGLSAGSAVDVDIRRALDDLTRLGLVMQEDENELFRVKDSVGAIPALRQTWISLFDDAREKR
jgi:hypothetical protein